MLNNSNTRIVGFMRNSRKPFNLVRLMAKASKYYNIDLVYFSPHDVDIENELINAKYLIDNKWVEQEITVPPFIDSSPYSLKYKKVIDFLNTRSTLSGYKLGSKNQVYEKIIADGDFKHLIIPSGTYTSFNEFYDFLEVHQHIIIKPKNGLRGHNIYSLVKNDGEYILSYQQTQSSLTFSELQEFYFSTLNGNDFIIQKYISSRTKSGDPFDCRIRLEKNGYAKWKVVIYLVRIGTNQKVVSNVAQGGSVTTLKPFLEANFPEKAEEIRTSIRAIGKKLPPKIEEIYNKNLNSMGIDIGIDKTGELFLFEVETGPGFEFGVGQVATTKVDYYNYILNEILETSR